jgi:pimeloyl-ACP methyl ester carboxylesterase
VMGRTAMTIGATIAIVLAIGVGLFVVRLARRPLHRFPYDLQALSGADYAALVAHPGWEKSTTTVAPGIALNGLRRRPKSPDAPWILFYPGNDATQLATAQRFIDRVIGDNDWGAAVYAYRGFDSSPGRPDLAAYQRDATAILDTLVAREHLDDQRVHIVAFSLGTWLGAAAGANAARLGRPVASVSLLATVDRLEMVRKGWGAGYRLGDVYETAAFVDALPAPVLVVMGGKDEALGVQQGRNVAKRLGNRVRYVELPEAGHVNLMEQPETADAVRAMIAAHSVAAQR